MMNAVSGHWFRLSDWLGGEQSEGEDMMGNGMYETSVKSHLRDFRLKKSRVINSLESLKKQDTEYAKEHLMLIDVFNRIIKVLEDA